ncbi:hypothetical protein BS17DRAFT_769449 [Gyrodon lividus]|nr:hypothetical protein BS17DRAFT_769449 [Gyrodon lividus]
MLQCDGWMGKNHHRLLGFMMTAQQKLHTVQVHDASRDPKTAKELLKQMLLAINIIETEWGSTWNLIVGDLFKVKDDYGKYGDMAQELIMWPWSKMQVLVLLCEIQMATIRKTLAII